MKYTLITGASRGIGEAMARYCAGKKLNLILIARSQDKLEELALKLAKKYEIDVKVYIADLTSPEAPSEIFNWCEENNLEVSILINNVGIGLYGRFESLSLEQQLEVIQLNQLTTVKMIYTFLPQLTSHDKSYILNVASTACYQPIPYMSVYAATQAFLQSFTLALREELSRKGVMVSCLCPGPTATDFFDRAGLSSLPVNSSEIKMSADEVAETAIEGMFDHVAEIVPGTSNTVGAWFSKLFPNKLVLKTVASLFAPR